MKSIRVFIALASLAITTFPSTAWSALVSHRTGKSNDIRFQWGVADSAANSGAGNVYFQLSAPDSYSWVGLGIGQGMKNAQMFLLYQDGNNNITLSTREGKGHILPLYARRNDVELLEGSGLVNGTMIANVKCSGCDGLDLGGSNGWIAAWRIGDSMDTTNENAPIQMHDSNKAFKVDFSQASVGSASNPFFVDEVSVDEGSSDGDAGDSSGGGASLGLQRTHGITMTLVFAGLYPLGSSLMPLFGRWYIHAGWQVIAYLLMWVGLGLGVVLADEDGELFNNAHTVIGVVVVSLLAVQPILGWFHHLDFRNNRKSGILRFAHVWYGRVLVILGIINGGLGLQLSGDTTGAFFIAYVVVTGAVALEYVASVAFGIFRRRKQTQAQLDDAKPETHRIA